MFLRLVARAIRNAIRANRFARIIRNRNPYFYSASGRFAQITRISDSRESPDSRESCESIRANHATKFLRDYPRIFVFGILFICFDFPQGMTSAKHISKFWPPIQAQDNPANLFVFVLCGFEKALLQNARDMIRGRIFSEMIRVSAQKSELQAKSRSHRPELQPGRPPESELNRPEKGPEWRLRASTITNS